MSRLPWLRYILMEILARAEYYSSNEGFGYEFKEQFSLLSSLIFFHFVKTLIT
jgi:hypothetical protein